MSHEGTYTTSNTAKSYQKEGHCSRSLGPVTARRQASTETSEARGWLLRPGLLTAHTNHAGPLQLLRTRLGETDATQRVVPAHSTHVIHTLGLLSLLGGLSAVNESTPASPHAILIQSPAKCPLDGVKAHVPDDGPNPGSNDIVAAMIKTLSAMHPQTQATTQAARSSEMPRDCLERFTQNSSTKPKQKYMQQATCTQTQVGIAGHLL